MIKEFFLILCLFLFNISCRYQKRTDKRILVFTKTVEYHHQSIINGIDALFKLGEEHGFTVDTTSGSKKFVEDSLRNYSAVLFLNTTGDVLDAGQQADFERYIQAGGGFVGVHAAADCEYHWPWYGNLVGAYFKSHPQQQEAVLKIHPDNNFPVTKTLPDLWKRKDEWYNFKKVPQNVNVLVSIDENSYEGGSNGNSHPMVWYHQYDGGRAFYIALGHTPESYQETHFLNLLWAGIEYAIGENKILNYKKATSLRKPATERFTKDSLAGNFDEPVKLTVLPDLSVLVAERKGSIKYYDPADGSVREVARIPVYDKQEMGLLGIQADHQFQRNKWVYVYYSAPDTSADRLSRFKFENKKFKMESEQRILNVPTDRELCCHTGGSIDFDAQGDLYLSVGDNTSPFVERDPVTNEPYPINVYGYAPLDDRPGYEFHDDRRASGNSNDLRGKILRIHVNDDGTYNIPEGNLFPVGTRRTRPEIYVMGGRNLYRMTVDKHTRYVYWGDVGPDARKDSLDTRGPKGYDEINQAREAGNFGWPYFVGNNYAYHEYDYATGKSGPAFDPENVVNRSRNNTGLEKLPPARPAFIWYPYDTSPDFPMLGSGGRTAMAGPVYYVKDFPKKTRYPDYYDGKLFIYDFIRGWIMAVTMNEAGDLQTIEPFMEGTSFHSPIDMQVGSDGRLYVLNYGKEWFAKNPEAALSVLTYHEGNLPPKAELTIDRVSGNAPLTVNISAEESVDPDGDPLTYFWDFGDGEREETNTPVIKHTYKSSGAFTLSVTVSDQKGGETRSKAVPIHTDGKGSDSTEALAAVKLFKSLDCQSCHQISERSVGPSYTEVASRYRDENDAENTLIKKILQGGSGNWGDRVMPAHPDLPLSDARTIVEWILTLGKKE